MAGKRRYDDGCAVAHGLELIGERWALLVVRELLLGPKRFTDLRTGLPGVSADVLTQRLRELQEAGVAQRRKLSPPAGSWIYELTEWGADLEPIITQLGRWSSRSPSMPRDADLSVDSLVLSLKTLFDPHAAEGFDVTVALRLGENQFRIRIADASIELARGDAEQPDLTIETDPDTLAALLRNDRQLAEALSAGDLTLIGAGPTAGRFLTLFPLPEPVTIAHVA
jgi:DNA-binding HxlR family transcriptional regulator